MFNASSVLTQIVVIIILLLGLALPAILCSVIGTRKGYNSVIFFLLGLLVSLAGLIIAIVLPSRHEQVTVGGFARVYQAVTLDDGRNLPRGLLGRVHDMRITGEIVVCEFEDPLGERHWVARSMLIPG